MEIIKIYEKGIWVENDIAGNRHIMIQHKDGNHEPFCYCTLYYDYAYTSNSNIKIQAEEMARKLGAKDLIEEIFRPINLTNIEE